MKTEWRRWPILAACAAVALCAACDGSLGGSKPQRAAPQAPTALELALAEQAGDHALDRKIRELQQRVPRSPIQAAELEKLGWTFIARARELEDPGSFNQALQCARAIEAIEPGSRAALLLRGHALHSLHRFKEAEEIARRLVADRGLPFDYGLLGDVLVDRGELEEATAAYQKMMDMRPDMHSYARAAHVRYLHGDLPGALSAMEMAARAASPRNRESFAWTWSKLAQYQLQAGNAELALARVGRALELQPDSQPALKVEALIRIARGELDLALAPLRKATARTSHPDLLWLLSDTLEALGQREQAGQVRARLLAAGAGEDPRAFALYLATRAERLELAEQLLAGELAQRHDIYSYEALAFVQSAKGEHTDALQNARRSLAAGTKDARLYYHAGLVAERAGDAALARQWLAEARNGSALLLPSQRRALEARAAAL